MALFTTYKGKTRSKFKPNTMDGEGVPQLFKKGETEHKNVNSTDREWFGETLEPADWSPPRIPFSLRVQENTCQQNGERP